MTTKPMPKWMPELVALLLLIPLVLILGAVLGKFTSTSPSTTLTSAVSISAVAIEPSPTISSAASPQVQAAISASQVPLQTALLDVQMPTGTKTYKVAIDKETVVADVMTKATAQGLVIQTKNYGGTLGLFVAALNGLSNDIAKQKYWTLYINGKRSEVGMSTATANPNDTITWKLETLTIGN